ncbi:MULTISPECIES: hypothetical protein [Xanthomonas]|uniref:hypothetical protein n=1 Tax=Xanthomonas TaxID=338 RepID=UPI0013B3CA27|nr:MULTISPECIES: hypothetical protein [Xanthomonas]QTD88029.1 hypothetical protein XcfCFBP6988P_23595 [Xanthomonas citri pv. phaseoli var. fuscans]QTF14104.1 hypothetical protein XcfCFBP6989P_23510 [Xanthomonas citri pv. phaseoli var. fuscans]QTF14329.1 hypothetical protein XcfCFBP6991P_24250 [Xanthomonas citri pv. phaseoli var. fuscans]QTF76305.1 hypothetical protein XcfCFBP6990P_23540 [Xanthomonas citri pv. phaseoli var. fuscans]UZB01958.1 hypothetical protein OM946_11580 [Xanthomonas citri 
MNSHHSATTAAGRKRDKEREWMTGSCGIASLSGGIGGSTTTSFGGGTCVPSWFSADASRARDAGTVGQGATLDMLQFDCTASPLRLLPGRLDAPFRVDRDIEQRCAV